MSLIGYPYLKLLCNTNTDNKKYKPLPPLKIASLLHVIRSRSISKPTARHFLSHKCSHLLAVQSYIRLLYQFCFFLSMLLRKFYEKLIFVIELYLVKSTDLRRMIK